MGEERATPESKIERMRLTLEWIAAPRDGQGMGTTPEEREAYWSRVCLEYRNAALRALKDLPNDQ